MDKETARYENKLKQCQSMTELLTAMSSWQSYCRSHGVNKEEEEKINALYLEMEGRLITKLRSTPW